MFCLRHSKLTNAWTQLNDAKTPPEVGDKQLQRRNSLVIWRPHFSRRKAAAPRTAPSEKEGRGALSFNFFYYLMKYTKRRVSCISKEKPFSAQPRGGGKSFSSTSAALILPQNTKHLVSSPPFFPFHHNLLWHVWADLSSNFSRIPHVRLHGWNPKGTKLWKNHQTADLHENNIFS